MLMLSLFNRLISSSAMARFHFCMLSLIFILHASKADANAVQTNKDFDNYKVLQAYKTLTLLCNASTSISSESKVTWKRGDKDLEASDRIKIHPDRLEIIKATEADADTYTCTVNHELHNGTTVPITETYDVIVKPTAWLPKTTNIVEGEKLVLNCTVTGKPTPRVTWVINGNETLTESTDRVKLQEDRGVTNALLVIEETLLSDRGDYKCVAVNIANTTETESFVRVKDKLAALWPFLGICLEVLILCTIILIYEKRRNKAELEESDTDQSPEQKNAADMGKDSEVRHRK